MEDCFLSPEGRKEHAHETSAATSSFPRDHHDPYRIFSDQPRGPVIDAVFRQVVDGEISWALVDPALHSTSPLATASTTEEEDEERSDTEGEPQAVVPLGSESSSRLRAHFLFPTSSNTLPGDPATSVGQDTMSEFLTYRPWSSSQTSDDYDDFDHDLRRSDYYRRLRVETPDHHSNSSPLASTGATPITGVPAYNNNISLRESDNRIQRLRGPLR